MNKEWYLKTISNTEVNWILRELSNESEELQRFWINVKLYKCINCIIIIMCMFFTVAWLISIDYATKYTNAKLIVRLSYFLDQISALYDIMFLFKRRGCRNDFLRLLWFGYLSTLRGHSFRIIVSQRHGGIPFTEDQMSLTADALAIETI